ncbi:conserved hypothetical protein [Leadbettera azotonutricia ZAS-9]|uniref:Uncharacterized protein n=1 Tax=Leadbettera azotonutricia (strain ATCC BAA-888 / DSM 13862 / ZAS-9) TaxID=545695 RepID=F5YBD0_LEAAZ|nr:conserved hypothetical protein [Leadbettera azotonutricia ZAS-9]
MNSQLFNNPKTQAKKSRGKGGIDAARFSDAPERSFLEALGDLGPLKDTSPSEEAVQQLLDNVRSTGDDLKNRPFPGEILNYKKAVRDFIHYVVENSYALVESAGIPNAQKPGYKGSLREDRIKQIHYHSIQVIDRKLDELAASILSGQASRMDRVAKLDEITGLLVDLTITGKIKERDE